MTKDVFEVLRYIAESKEAETSQRIIAKDCGFSLGKVNSILKDLAVSGFIDEGYKITEAGLGALTPYKVDNAIILAAGMSTRFVPVSYEIPKGLISVKGEVMTERLIRQLHEAGVEEVVLVVGYMMEKFLYLSEKYGVKFVVNPEYETKNTHSSIYAAREYLGNTYILCSDNYYPENMFHRYEYRAFYCSIYLPGISYVERGFVFDKNNLIVSTDKPSNNQWIMYGHAYYSREFTESFVPILLRYYNQPGVEYMYWETIYAENVTSLKMWGMKCTAQQILEFDSVEELTRFDPDYIHHNKVKVFDNICKVLKCDLSDISSIEIIAKGLNNQSFKFNCKGKSYVYRHPGKNAEHVIDRKKEAKALNIAKKLKIDNTLVYVDSDEGWKISEFIETCDTFDFNSKRHIALLSNELKKLHSSKKSVGFSFDYNKEADRIIEKLSSIDSVSYAQALEYKKSFEPIFEYLDKDKWQFSLCHNDIYEPNILVEENRVHLIDWEFAGDSDIGYDICKLFSVITPEFDGVDEWLEPYYSRATTFEEKLHLFACAAVIYYYWYVWSLYTSRNGGQTSSYMMDWYEKMRYYCNEVTKRLEKEN